MDCQEAQRLLQADVDGELDAVTSAQLAAHVAGCAACQAERAGLLALKTAVKAAPVRAAPEALRRRIAIAIAQEAAKSAPKKRAFKLSWAWLNGGLAGVGALAFAFVFALYVSRPSDLDLLEQDVITGHTRAMMVSHLADVASTDQHTVKPWFADKLDFAPNVADFTAQGYPLVGGRLDYLDHHDVAAIVYRHRLHTINLYEWPERGHMNAPALSVSHDGYQLVHWAQNGMHYWLVSDMNAQELNEFKDLLVAQVEKSEQR